MHPEVTPIPVGRVIEKLDSYLDVNDSSGAERHLSYWLAEADAGHDMRGKLTVLNEQIGLYRKLGRETEGTKAISDALSLSESMGIENSVTYGTTLINAATGYNAFGRPEDALPLYRKARAVYESLLDPADARLGGLYNNMALTFAAIGSFREAEQLYDMAIGIMSKQENGEAETAITYLNLADLAAAEAGLEAGEKKINEYLNKARELLDTESLPRDGYYAFVCEKCAPVFGFYGFFLVEKELVKRAEEIHERT